MPSQLLHKAVLEEDFAKLRLFREDRALKAERDANGFTAIELARYLGKTQCLRVLREWNPSKLKVVPRNGQAPLEYQEAEIEEVLGFRFVSSLLFPSYDLFIETLARCPWLLKYTPLGHECRRFGRSYSMGQTADVAVKWIDEAIGYGLFSESEIPAGTLIGEYAGAVRILPRKNPDPNGYCAHYPTKWWSHDYTVIDAQDSGNAIRFVNHSDAPNLRSAWALERNLMHLLFLAKEDIHAGEQLTINYGPDYWQFRKKLVM